MRHSIHVSRPPSGRFWSLALCACACVWAAQSEELYRADGERLEGAVGGAGHSFKAGATAVDAGQVLLIRFSNSAAPQRLANGVCLRDGSLLAGELDALVGDKATVSATSLGKSLELARAELSGAFFALPPGMPENFPALGGYARMLAALNDTTGESEGAPLSVRPGQRHRVTYRNLEVVEGQLARLKDKAFIELPGGNYATPGRDVVRLVEFKTEPLAPEKRGTPGLEALVRMKAGDVLRGRVLKLDAQTLTLETRFAGKLELPRDTLAVLYPAGGAGSGLTWLSTLPPKESLHVPAFDAEFPARMNLSCDGQLMRIGGLPCDRGIGVHAKSKLSWDLKPAAGRKFVARVGLDDETNGRGAAIARVLLDGQALWESKLLTPESGAVPVCVEVSKGGTLTLEVDFGPDGDDSGDHVNWGWAALVGP